MALLFVDGFEADDLNVKWSTVEGFATSTSTTRFGTGRCITGSAFSNTKKMITASAQVTAGAAMYVPTVATSQAGIQFFGDSGATTHLTIQRNATSSFIEVRRGTQSGTVLATGTTALAGNTWHYIEVQATIADAGGTVKVRLNGSSTDEINFTGDTKNAGTNTTIDAAGVVSSTGVNARFDDIYVLNSTGSSNTTFLGDVRVQTLMPNGNGTHSQLTGSDGNSTDNYQLVDEQPYSSADYVGSSTVGQRDTYAMENLLAGTASVFGVQNNFIGAKSDAGAIGAKSALLIGGTLYYGSTRSLPTGYVNYHDIHNTNPNTSADWTVSDVNGTESGVEIA